MERDLAAAKAEALEDNKDAICKLYKVSALCIIFMIAEIIGGYLANSLAIMTDAAHLLSDLLGFVISVVALLIGQRDPTAKLSFGYHRSEILGALASTVLIWGLTIWLIYEAVIRVITQPDVDGKLMLIVAVIGFVRLFAL